MRWYKCKSKRDAFYVFMIMTKEELVLLARRYGIKPCWSAPCKVTLAGCLSDSYKRIKVSIAVKIQV